MARRLAGLAAQKDLPWLDSGKVDRRRLTAVLEDRFGSAAEQR